MLHFALETVPQAEPTPHHRLRAELSRCGSGRRGSRSPPETDSLPRPCFAALKGEAKNRAVESCRADCRLMGFSPNTETFSAVHPISVAAAIGRARSLGVLRGRSRIEFIVSPLPRRRHNESHFAAQSPERAFLAKPFFARAKNGVNSGRRSLKISVSEAKCNICRHKRAAALHLNP